jgi:tripartite-type tricarboxylate transporter receptor subunit TctC
MTALSQDVRQPSIRRGASRRAILSAIVLAALSPAVLPTKAAAQQGPIRLIVPFPPGGGVDGTARVLANGLSAHLGRTVIVENRPGASTMLAAEMVARSEPDGQTLLFTLDQTFTTVPLLSKHLSIDPGKDLIPVNLVAKIPMVMLSGASVPAQTLPDLINYARANPGKVNYSSSGPGGTVHLSMEMLKALTKVEMLHVPYRGVAPALTAVASGDVHVTIGGYSSARGLIDAGRVKAIAIAGPDKAVELPTLPTTRELGYEKVDATTWLAVAAPGKMSSDKVEKLNQAISTVLKTPEARKQITDTLNFVISDVGPKEFKQMIADRLRVTQEAIKIAGIEAQ